METHAQTTRLAHVDLRLSSMLTLPVLDPDPDLVCLPACLPACLPCLCSGRVLGGLFYYGHVHGEDLYGRTIRELNEDPKFHQRAAAAAGTQPQRAAAQCTALDFVNDDAHVSHR